MKCLEHHFTERYSEPTSDVTNKLYEEANAIWNMYNTADVEDIRLAANEFDLQFTEQDIKATIGSLKRKGSSGFDQISNEMVKHLPSHFHGLLTRAYNGLFHGAHWGKSWKTARTLCFNKSDSSAPTTNQIRPISILPAFSKIYERLFLLRFNTWAKEMNIIPDQQSGARPHQTTTSRVNCLLEQIIQ